MSLENKTLSYTGQSFNAPFSEMSQANLALQQALKTLATDVRTDMVFRCEELPVVFLSPAKLEAVFSKILQTLLALKESSAPLYLHLQCVAVNGQESNAEPKAKGNGFYELRFETNLRPSADCLKKHKAIVDEANSLLKENDGHLHVNGSKSSGCLFSLRLPGKF